MGVTLACAACGLENALAEDIAEAAHQTVAPMREPAPPAKGKWAPQDTCGEVEGAAQFRQRLAAVIEARDADALVMLAADDIKLDFGGGEGRTELRSRLEASGELWDELDALMTLGCSANDEGGVTIPWYFDQHLGEADPFTAWMVTGEDVLVHAGPDDASERRAAISWDLVELAEWNPELPRQQVRLPDGTAGFIATDKLRSLIDYRLLASSRNGRWRITTLIAGD